MNFVGYHNARSHNEVQNVYKMLMSRDCFIYIRRERCRSIRTILFMQLWVSPVSDSSFFSAC